MKSYTVFTTSCFEGRENVMGKRGPKPGSGLTGGSDVGRLGGRPVSATGMIKRLSVWHTALQDEITDWGLTELSRCAHELRNLSEMFADEITRRYEQIESDSRS
jgi:hypothetical protein